MAPRVPRYEEQQVRETALATPQTPESAPAEAFGGGQAAGQVGQETRGMVQDATKLVLQERDAADSLMVQKADLDTANEKLRLAKDPKTGFLNVRGQEALTLPDSVGEAFQASTEKIRERLNDRQRAAYDKLLMGHKRDINEQIQGHMFVEMRKFDEATTEARLATAKDEAGLNPSRAPELINEQWRLIDARANRADLAGQAIPPEEVARQKKEVTSKTQMAVISQMLLANADQEAREYYDFYKKTFTAADAKAIDSALRQGTILGESQRQATAIMGKDLDEKAALERARKIDDPEIQRATVQEIKGRFEEDRAFSARNQEDAMHGALSILAQARNIRAVPASVMSDLTDSNRAVVERYAAIVRAGGEPKTDEALYFGLKDMAANDATREAFTRGDLTRHRADLSNAAYQDLLSLQGKLRTKGRSGADQELDGFRSKSQIVNDTLAQFIDPTPKPGSAKAKEVASFRALVEQEIRAAQRTHPGKEVTNEEVQQISDRLALSVFTKNMSLKGIPIPFTSREERVYEQLATKKSDINATLVGKIETDLRRRNVAVTDAAVVDQYNFMVQRRLGLAR